MSTGDYTCPTCRDDFATRRGLGVHHVHTHDERLPNRTCDECGNEFYSTYEKKYCSAECLKQAAPYAREDPPNYRGAKETTGCVFCGTTFEYYPSDKPGLYCPECVESRNWRSPSSLDGEQNPRWGGGTVELDCDVCGDTFDRHPSSITGEVTLCGEECRAAWLSDAYTGEGHPNWKGGGNEPYGKGWARVRRKALKRDGHQCVNCGTTKDAIGRNSDVHHITPVRAFVESADYKKEDAHSLDNVVSLCVACHRRADFGNLSPSTLRRAIDAD